MSVEAILAPLFVQIALTFMLLFWMGRARAASVKRGEVKISDIALGQQAWPARATQIANCFHNQFQLPVLFYVLIALALSTRKADLPFVVLSWLFVATRVVHAAIHVTSNNVPRRFYAFLGGAIVLILMWAMFAARMLVGL